MLQHGGRCYHGNVFGDTHRVELRYTHTHSVTPVFTSITDVQHNVLSDLRELMERYESLGLVGEGSYGTVLKCRHRDSGRLVAIKKFVDSDDDKTVKKIALREIKLLRQLRHDNLVNLLEVWKRRRRWYLVFEFVERTLLDDLEQNPSGLDQDTSRQHLYQVLRAAAFCHQQNIIHRDIKPENILISQGGIVKMCDFGFARTVASPAEDTVYTDYVATRWYRAPELLVGDTQYGKPVDVWAVGCLLLEMLTGQPLFPGDSDLDQIYHIVRCFGNLTAHHQDLFYRNPVFSGVQLPECSGMVRLEQRFLTIPPVALDLAQMDPERRAQCSELQEHLLFTQDSFHIRFLDELKAKIQKDHRENSTLPKITKNLRRERNDRDDKDKDRRSKDKKREKVNKETKAKQRLSKTLHDASETLMSIKPSKTGTETEIPKSPEILISDSQESATDTKDVNGSTAEPKYGKSASPELREEPKVSRNSTTDRPNGSSSPKASLKHVEAASAAKIPNNDPLTPSGLRSHKEQRKTSECPTVLPSNPKLTKATSNFSPKLKNSPSKTLSSDLSSIPSHSTAAQPKSSSSSHPKPTNDTTCVPRKPPRVFPADRGHPEELIAANTCCSNKDFKEDDGGLKTIPTAVDLTEVSETSGGSSESCRVHQHSESKNTSSSVVSAVLKTASDEENLVLSASVQSSTSKVSGSEAKPNEKSLRPTRFRSLIGEPKTKPGSNKTTSLTTSVKKSTFPPEARKKRENPERIDARNKLTSDHKPSPPPSPPPPPPPPPSSTPLLFVGSPPSDHLPLGSGLHPGPHGLRCVDESKHRGGFSSRRCGGVAGPQAAQVTENNVIGERHFLSDRCNHGNSGGVATTKKKSDVHFPDLLRGREGKNNKGAAKDQRKDKQALPSKPQHGHSSTQ